MGDTDRLLCVSPSDVHALWPYVSGFIKDALEGSNSRLSPTNIYQQLRNEEALLWVAVNSTEIFGAMVTEVGYQGDTKICTILSLGSTSFKRCWKFSKDIYQYARNEGCTLVRLYGRPGWMRALRGHGYTQPWIALEKVL